MGKLAVFLISLFALSPVFAKEEFISDSEVAETVFYSTLNAKDFLEVVERSDLKQSNKQEISDYLKLHHFEKQFAKTKWSDNSTVIEIFGNSKTHKLDFSDFVKTKSIKFDGVTVDGTKLKVFSDLVAKFEAAGRKTSLLDLIFPEAKADDDLASSVLSAILYHTGIDQLEACAPGKLSKFFGEEMTQSQCTWKSNSQMMIKDIGPYGSIAELNCTTGGFKSAGINMRSGPIKLVATRDYNNKLSALSYYSDNALDCEFSLKNGMMKSVKNDTQAPELCIGRALGDHFGDSHHYSVGDKPSYVSQFPISVQRLDACCNDSKCRTEIAAAIKQHSSHSSKPGASAVK